MGVENNIPEGWVDTTLDGICDKMYSGGTPSTKRDDYYGGDIPWIRTQEVKFNYILDAEIKITELGLKNSSARYIPKNTIIIAMYGNSAGRVAYSKIEATTNQACCNFVSDKDKCDPSFVYFNLLGRYREIEGKANGAAQQNLSVGVLKELSINLPPIQEQKAIANVLTAFDDKIELLKVQSKTLESMAQTIFAAWFGKCQIGDELPEGWRVGEINDLVEVVIDNRGKTPPLIDQSNESYPLIEVNSITGDDRNVNLALGKKFVDEETYQNWFRKGHPQNGDILLSTVGSIGQLAQVFNEKICVAQNIVALRSNTSGNFLYELLKKNQKLIINLDISSVQPSIKVPHLISMPVVIPKLELIQQFDRVVNKITIKITSNNQQIQSLIKTRDTLLPKLMSGQVRVNNIKQTANA